MSALELIAAAFGALAVYLSARERILSWPVGMVNVALYTVVFYQARLYADMGLQVIYFALAAYGWYEWKYGGDRRTELAVSRASRRTLASLAVVNLVLWLTLAVILDRYTDAAIPYLDSLLATTSLVAQWLMTRKLLESWAVWILVDAVYVPMFVSRGLYPTAVLYLVFLVLALFGWREWKRSLHARASTGASTPLATVPDIGR